MPLLTILLFVGVTQIFGSLIRFSRTKVKEKKKNITIYLAVVAVFFLGLTMFPESSDVMLNVTNAFGRPNQYRRTWTEFRFIEKFHIVYFVLVPIAIAIFYFIIAYKKYPQTENSKYDYEQHIIN